LFIKSIIPEIVLLHVQSASKQKKHDFFWLLLLKLDEEGGAACDVPTSSFKETLREVEVGCVVFFPVLLLLEKNNTRCYRQLLLFYFNKALLPILQKLDNLLSDLKSNITKRKFCGTIIGVFV
jgi:hypothetical protein